MNSDRVCEEGSHGRCTPCEQIGVHYCPKNAPVQTLPRCKCGNCILENGKCLYCGDAAQIVWPRKKRRDVMSYGLARMKD